MSYASMKAEQVIALESALAAAQAEVARLGAQRRELITDLQTSAWDKVAFLAEIAALRRVLAGVVERCASGTGGYVGQDGQYIKEIRAALSTPSAAEPLLADIRAAVVWMHNPDENVIDRFDKLADWFHADTSLTRPGRSVPAALAGQNQEETQKAWVEWVDKQHRAALSGLRRWVP